MTAMKPSPFLQCKNLALYANKGEKFPHLQNAWEILGQIASGEKYIFKTLTIVSYLAQQLA